MARRLFRILNTPIGIVLLIGFQAAALLLVALLTLPQIGQWHALDLQVYFNDARSLLKGWVPYRDFNLEYPPLALAAFAGPFLAVRGKPLLFTEYAGLFLLQSAVLSAFIAWALARAAALSRPSRPAAVPLAVYTLLVVLTAPLLPWRYDLFPALFTILALVAVLAGKPAQVGVWLGLGTAAKLYPVVLLPIVGAYYLASVDWRAVRRLGLGFAGALALVVLPLLLSGAGGAMMEFLHYHELRGLQLESLPAGLILLAHMAGAARVSLSFNYGALHLVSPLATATLRWLPLLFIALYGAVLLCALARFRQDQVRYGSIPSASLVAYLTAALLVFIATNKVFSPQYIIWLLPFVPLLRSRQVGIAVAAFLATIALFPYDYANLLALHDGPVLVLNMRNLLVAGLLVTLVARRRPSRSMLRLTVYALLRRIPLRLNNGSTRF